MAEAKKKRGWTFGDGAIALVLVVVVGGLVAARMLYTPYRIPSSSMAPTLMQGEYVAAQNGRPQVHAGDVVFHTQENEPRRTFVRRVLAMPGQRISFRDGVPVVDGVPAQQVATGDTGAEGERIMRETLGGRSYLVAYREDGMPELRNTREITVPQGRVYLIGDSRDNSADSRIYGPQPIANIKQAGGWIIFSATEGRAGHRIE